MLTFCRNSRKHVFVALKTVHKFRYKRSECPSWSTELVRTANSPWRFLCSEGSRKLSQCAHGEATASTPRVLAPAHACALAARDITLGNLGSSNILLTEHLWVQVAPSIPLLLGDRHTQPRHIEGLPRRPLVATPRRAPGEDLPLTYRWVKGMVSNLEYLLAVNAAAGRVVGDRSSHPIVPWVSDFARKVTEGGKEDVGCAQKEQEENGGQGWRDLTMTKFRLKKGDEQVNFSNCEHGGSEIARFRNAQGQVGAAQCGAVCGT